MITTFDKFNLAEKAEHLAAELYRILAEHFEDEPEAKALFKRLEQEEIQHAMRIKMLRKHYVINLSDVKEISLDTANLRDVMQEGEILKQRFKSGNIALSIDEATTFMSGLEEKFADAHAEMMSMTSDPSLQEFFEKLVGQDRGHISLLRQ